MKKAALFLVSIVFLTVPSSVQAASFVTITSDGLVRTNVLGDSASLESGAQKVESAVKNIKGIADATLTLVKDGEKALLTIESSQGTKKDDVTKLTKDIIEIEQEQGPKSIKIGKVNDNFGISQAGITALTSYPIHVNAQSKELSVATESGERIIGILPDEAIETLVRANIINTLSQDGQMVLGESDEGELTYSIAAERQVNLFNLHTISVPVNTTVSATSGKVLRVDQPKWLKFLGFLFS